MKTVQLGFLLLLLLFTAPLLSAQDLVNRDSVVEVVKAELTPEQLQNFKSADNFLAQVSNLEKEIDEEEDRIARFFAKKNKRRAERKAKKAKQFQIQLADLYFKGYNTKFRVFQEVLSKAVFEYEADQEEAQLLSDEAKAVFDDARKKITDWKELRNRELKKDMVYSQLVRRVNDMKESMDNAIDKQIKALDLWLKQEQKKQAERQDMQDWQVALKENTIPAYQEYISKHPYGKYVSQAHLKIAELEELARKERERRLSEQQENENAMKGIVFKVQIIAVKEKMSDEELQEFYPTDQEILETHEEGLYKYSIGSFDTYEAARQHRRQIGNGAFVVSFRDGEKIEVRHAIELLKDAKNQ